MRSSRAATLALALALAAAPALAARPADPAPVIAAELAFAARAAEAGISTAFLDFMTDDAIVFAPDPEPARRIYGDRPPSKSPKEGGTLLAWWPNWAGIARSGDLGFTTGPAEVNGRRTQHYFTVWVRQPDGGWKWVYDGGAQSDARKAPGPKAPVLTLKAGDPAPMDAAQAFAEVQKAEAALATAAAEDLVIAYEAVIADDSRIQGSPLPPATAPRDVARELATRAPQIDFRPLGGSASKAGDLAWTYGSAHWPGARGHYVRIWQRRNGAWKLVFDQILEVPPPATASR